MENEIWKPVVGYEGLYEVSNLGRVKSINRNIILKLRINKNCNYIRIIINLYLKSVPKTFTVSRLVAQAFIPNPENKPCVNHIDSNPQNNNMDNLEWCTQKENMEHAKNNNRMSICEKHGRTKLSNNQVLEIIKLIPYFSYSQIAKKYNISNTTVHNIRYGLTFYSITN